MMAVVPKQPEQPEQPEQEERTPPADPADAARPAPDPRPVLPQRGSDETDAGWGERPEPDDDERLRQDRPPHYDR
jgi:hypothetical protein